MRVLMLSTDNNILRPASEARQRMADYGTLVDELDIVVCCLRDAVSGGEASVADNVRVFPTRSPYKIFYVWDAVKTAKKQIKGKIDLVTAQDPFETGLAGYLAARRLGAKLQLQIHTDFLSPYFTKESFKNRIRVRLAKWLLPKADSIRVVSQRIKNSLSNVKCQMSNVVILSIFVDAQKIQSAPITIDLHQKYPQFDFIILMASRLSREKNVGLAIRSMTDVVNRQPSVGLIIVGDGPEKNNLRFKTRNLKLETNIVFEQWTNDLTSYYKTSDAFLNTSNYEGYGRTLIEAAAAGCPVITTDVGAVGEVINSGNCLIVPVGDQAAIATALLQLATDKNLRQTLGRAAQKAVLSLRGREEHLIYYQHSW